MARPFPNFYVLLWNLGGDAAVNAQQRRESVRAVLNTLYNPPIENLFVLCQNRINTPLDDTIFDENLWREHRFALGGRRTRGENHAAIYHNRELDFQVECLPENCLQVLPEKDRLMVYIVEYNFRKILLASYHGPHILQEREKLSIINNLVSFLDGLRAGKDCFLAILGGTFNIDAAKVRSDPRIQNMPVEVLSGYVPPADRAPAPFSDFVIRWPRQDADVQEIETTVVLRDFQRQMGERPFAHPLVLYRFGNRFEEERLRLAAIDPSTDLDDRSEFEAEPDYITEAVNEVKQSLTEIGAAFTFTSLSSGLTEDKVREVQNSLLGNSTYRLSAIPIVHIPDFVFVTRNPRIDMDVALFSRDTEPQDMVHFDQLLRSSYGGNAVFVVYGLIRRD
ncbi:hypothetical protein BaRGS_00038266 [Batillaria attramentaria]|uniref:Endonuclease/exonuclease/phosphatase domain-containing protein n=1 Tax=Batillaria attramentaria TaxID=370345 RepID=A0ABD0J6C7_9CAEN